MSAIINLPRRLTADSHIVQTKISSISLPPSSMISLIKLIIFMQSLFLHKQELKLGYVSCYILHPIIEV